MEYWERRPAAINVLGIGLFVAATIAATWVAAWCGLIDDSFAGTSRLIWYALLCATTLLTVRYHDRRSATWVGLGRHRWLLRELATGLLLGFGMALLAWIPCALLGTVSTNGAIAWNQLLVGTGYMALSAAGEELLFRGYFYQRLNELLGVTTATIVMALLFGLAHLQNPEVTAMALVNVSLASIFFSLCYLRTGSLWLPMAAHAAWNVTVARVVGMPVSGINFGEGLLQTSSNAAPVFTGGTFGPEGGLVATIALVVGSAVLFSPLVKRSPYIYAARFWEGSGMKASVSSKQ
ncbi:MAG: CPBP family intramembrane metalloprotease [Chlorobi bacterium]|nr:CPBP family intramembrane metalloprotease [Chlorobiota bacterium]